MLGCSSMNFLTLRSKAATSAGLSGLGLLPTVMVTGAFSSIAPPLPLAEGVVPSAQAAVASNAAAEVRITTNRAVLVIGTPQVSGITPAHRAVPGVWSGPQKPKSR